MPPPSNYPFAPRALLPPPPISTYALTTPNPLRCYKGAASTSVPSVATRVGTDDGFDPSFLVAYDSIKSTPIPSLLALDSGAKSIWSDNTGRLSATNVTKIDNVAAAMIKNGFPNAFYTTVGDVSLTNQPPSLTAQPAVTRARFFRNFTATAIQALNIYAFCFSPCFLFLNGVNLGIPYSTASSMDGGVSTQATVFTAMTQVGLNFFEFISHSYPEDGRFPNSTDGIYATSGVWLAANTSAGQVLRTDTDGSWFWTTDDGPNFGYTSDVWCGHGARNWLGKEEGARVEWVEIEVRARV